MKKYILISNQISKQSYNEACYIYFDKYISDQVRDWVEYPVKYLVSNQIEEPAEIHIDAKEELIWSRVKDALRNM